MFVSLERGRLKLTSRQRESRYETKDKLEHDGLSLKPSCSSSRPQYMNIDDLPQMAICQHPMVDSGLGARHVQDQESERI
jgi:hypothetical protein